ncbi:CoA transferase [Amnibacterium sp. CER49]|uniref:CoA transferase n=1 Tax=Amnibacterium sp. CER49 TaxID=3039161 RepID=UPI002447B506|nr:CoA transferase [Amnibacterium sp. CER49]MDH2445478.1 CoA transferase [Amnibacterium sp. CER49]
MEAPAESALRAEACAALGLDPVAVVGGAGTLESVYAVNELAAASVATFGDARAHLLPGAAEVRVDRALACTWFGPALRPVGWALPSPWDPIAGDYAARDGWIRLHTNAPHHRRAALAVLGTAEEREAVASAVRTWDADELEAAVVGAGGCAATMRSPEAWAAHVQGSAVQAEPLVAVERLEAGQRGPAPHPRRPLAGVRVLDLTRVLAGPAATRALAAAGAAVLRVDPPDWDEPAVVPEMTLGKRAARLDARAAEGRDRLVALLAEADVLVSGYRADALESLGLGDVERARIRPGLVEVALDAYGWTGPWAGRRGFDSLVQMSSGVAERGMRRRGADRPVPLPVQALDQATGWLMAAAAVTGIAARHRDGRGYRARLSLARTAAALQQAGPGEPAREAPAPMLRRIATPWGDAELPPLPLEVAGAPLRFEAGPVPLGGDPPAWE